MHFAEHSISNTKNKCITVSQVDNDDKCAFYKTVYYSSIKNISQG